MYILSFFVSLPVSVRYDKVRQLLTDISAPFIVKIMLGNSKYRGKYLEGIYKILIFASLKSYRLC